MGKFSEILDRALFSDKELAARGGQSPPKPKEPVSQELRELREIKRLARRHQSERIFPGMFIFVGVPVIFGVCYLAANFLPMSMQDALGGWIVVIAFVVGLGVASTLSDLAAK